MHSLLHVYILYHDWCCVLFTLCVCAVAAQLLGFRNYIPPYSVARGAEVLRGLNFASGAAGIRGETGNNLVNFIVHYFILLLS